MTERTPLRGTTPVPQYDPQYVFNTGRVYRHRVRQFQCCVCATVLACFVLALVVTVAYSVNESEDGNNSTNNSQNDVLVSLLTLQIPLQDPEAITWEVTPSASEIEGALQFGLQMLEDRDTAEKMGPRLQQNTPSYRHQMAVKTGAEAAQLSRAGYVLDTATRYLITRGTEKHNRTKLGRGPSIEADWMPEEACPDNAYTPCIPTKYRSADGSCNNPLHPFQWGVAMRPFRRTLHPDYADRVSAPRRGTSKKPLPSARAVSVLVHRPVYQHDPAFTVMLAVWGQFIDHDITATALSVNSDGGAISCCGAEAIHPECFPVLIDEGDPYFHQFNLTCMEFIRSAPAPVCTLGPREQLNQASAFLDGSAIYGPKENLTIKLRSFEGGQLQMEVTPDGRSLLPFSSDPSDGCNQEKERARGRYCFAAGDARANENLHLTTMHLLWARQHNLVAKKLLELNPLWPDEKVFQEARRIVVAQLQHITYNEFLPVLLGDDLMEHLDINADSSGYYYGYDATINPSIANSFASAAFRFAHTLLPGLMKMIRNGSEEYVELHRMLFNPYSLYSPGRLDDTLRGALATNVEKVNPYFTTELTEHLFEKKEAPPCGLDLVSLNIQRGRDHGLPSYPWWREKCGLSRPRSFLDLESFMDNDTVRKLSQLYASVEDVDLYTGALSEQPISGGFLGATITCLIADQFTRLKRGDRYWYETPEKPQAFTPRQLAELRKSTLARIICDNADNVTHAQTWVMHSVGPTNLRVSCETIESPDFSLWREPSRAKITSLTTSLTVLSAQLIGNVTSGRVISEAGSVIWTGELPIPFPSDITLRPQWRGEIHDSALEGVFSQYKDGLWVNGIFSFHFTQTSDRFVISNDLGTFTSPIYFKEIKEEIPFSSQIPQFETELSTKPTVQNEPDMTTAQIVLEGGFSSDRKVFLWNGGFVITIPSTYSGDSTLVRPEGKQILNNLSLFSSGGMISKRISITPKSNPTNNTTSSSRHKQISQSPTNNMPLEIINGTETSDVSNDTILDPNDNNTFPSNGTWTEVEGSIISGGMTSDMGALEWKNFTIPLYFQLPSSAMLQWNGSLTMETPWTAIMQGIVGDSYFLLNLNLSKPLDTIAGAFISPIHFKELDTMLDMQTIVTTRVDLNALNIISTNESCNCKIVPVTLFGAFAENENEFLWTGLLSLYITEQ